MGGLSVARLSVKNRQDERNRDEKSDQIDPAMPESFQLAGICNVFSSWSFVNGTRPRLKGAAATYVPRTTEA
jgi:hypothetical protein